MIVRDIISFGFYFTIYEKLKSLYGNNLTPLYWKLLSGGTAGVVAWTIAFPFDSLKLRMQTTLT